MGTWQERLARAAEPFRQALEEERKNAFWRTWGEKAALTAGEEAHNEAGQLAAQLDALARLEAEQVERLNAKIAELQKRRDEETARADAWRSACHAWEEAAEIAAVPLQAAPPGSVQAWKTASEEVLKASRLQARHDAPPDGVARRSDG